MVDRSRHISRRCSLLVQLLPETRFSSMRYSMTCCWWRLTHPARVTNSSRKGRHRPILPCHIPVPVPGTGSAEYSDTTRPSGVSLSSER